MRAKYDWIKLKSEFVLGEWLTLADFFRAKSILNNSRSRTNAKGWLAEKRKYQEEVAVRTREKIIETTTEVRARQQELGKSLQSTGLEKLKNMPVETVQEARKLVIEGLKIEREALGLQRGGLTPIQLNSEQLPKTEFEDIVEDLSYEEINKLITELKKMTNKKTFTP